MNYRKNEKGVVLITAIMLLVILTIIGLAAVDLMQDEKDIATGETAYRLGFYNADSGINYARVYVKQEMIENTPTPFMLSTPKDYKFSVKIKDAWLDEKSHQWRYRVESTSIPDDFAGTVTVEAEIMMATASRGMELDPGNETTY